jgi:signal peptidase
MAAEVLQSNGVLRLGVTGSSMLPALWPGDVVTIAVLAEEPRIGEIILFQRSDQFVIHRVIRVASGARQSQIITRGDSMSDRDNPIEASEVLGRVVAIQRGPHEFPVVTKRSSWQKGLGFLFGRSNFLSNLALRWHAARRAQLGFAPPISEGTR